MNNGDHKAPDVDVPAPSGRQLDTLEDFTLGDPWNWLLSEDNNPVLMDYSPWNS